MGYRSDVGLCLTLEGQTRFTQALRAMHTSPDYADIQEFLDCAEQKHDQPSGAAAYHWQQIKWYEDYPEISFMESYLREADDEHYLFIRIGEDYDDSECAGDFWDNPFGMTLRREVVFGGAMP